MAETFESPIGIDRQRATPLKEALIDILSLKPERLKISEAVPIQGALF